MIAFSALLPAVDWVSGQSRGVTWIQQGKVADGMAIQQWTDRSISITRLTKVAKIGKLPGSFQVRPLLRGTTD